MLPSATSPRSSREGRKGQPSGRTMEIQRLIGRSLRAVLDLAAIPETTLHIDYDVHDADGGTRTAAITGSYVALRDAVKWGLKKGLIPRDPIKDQIAAVSAGIVNTTRFLDLTYEEDSQADFDLNLVASGTGQIIEIQGTAEGPPVARSEVDSLINLAYSGIERLFRHQNAALSV